MNIPTWMTVKTSQQQWCMQMRKSLNLLRFWHISVLETGFGLTEADFMGQLLPTAFLTVQPDHPDQLDHPRRRRERSRMVAMQVQLGLKAAPGQGSDGGVWEKTKWKPGKEKIRDGPAYFFIWDLSPPQHPGSSCCTKYAKRRQADRVQASSRTRGSGLCI